MNAEALSQHAEATIARGSKSFAAAARLFAPDTRQSAVLLYAWCRHCDDLIDGQELGFGQHGGGGHPALARLEQATREVYANRRPADPAFAALREVVRRHDIPARYPLDHLAGFRMDVEGRHYRRFEDTLEYCYHVAGVVGVMMAMVMGVRDEATLHRACDQGIAFQLTNIARDIVEDAQNERIYLPADWLEQEGLSATTLTEPAQRPALARLAARLVDAAEPYYASAYDGLAALPLRSAWSIATARLVYRQIGVKVTTAGPAAWDARVGTTALDKLRLVGLGGLQALASRTMAVSARPAGLWTRGDGAAARRADGATLP